VSELATTKNVRAPRYRKLALASERRPTRTCFLSSQTNAIEGFSAPPIGNGHHAKMSSSQKAGDAKFQFEWER
jgi:hypothetical protein